MTTIKAYYKSGFGLAGCYLDDSQGSPQCYTRRKDLARAIRADLEWLDWPASCIREVPLRRLWGLIKHARSASSFTFYIHHGAHVLTFYGLTEREYLEERATNEGADQDDLDAWAAYQERYG